MVGAEKLDAELIEAVCRAMITAIGDDPDDGIGKTPDGRIIRAWERHTRAAKMQIAATNAIFNFMAKFAESLDAETRAAVMGLAKSKQPSVLASEAAPAGLNEG